MAAAGQSLRLCVSGCRRIASAPRIAPRAATRFTQQPQQQRRAFAVSSTRRDVGHNDWGSRSKFKNEVYSVDVTAAEIVEQLKPEEVKALERLRKRDPSAQDMSLEQFLEREMQADGEKDDESPIWTPQEWKRAVAAPRPNKSSFWFDTDNPKADTEGVMDQFEDDDMMTMAHGKLDEIREHRHYNRIMAWEMPLLSKLAKPFEPPAADEVLRFRYTTYMGEYHPAEKKVVVEFSPTDLQLTPVQADKLRKLAGARYNPETDVIKMSSEKFEEQAQNKRYLSDLVDKLVENAKDPKDTFEDIPLDTRHHKFKKAKPKFPVEWRMTEERQKELDEARVNQIISESNRQVEGQVVDGAQTIQQFLEAPEDADKEPELVAVRGRGGQKVSRR